MRKQLFVVAIITTILTLDCHQQANACSPVPPTAWRVFVGTLVDRRPAGVLNQESNTQRWTWTFIVRRWDRKLTTSKTRPNRLTVIVEESHPRRTLITSSCDDGAIIVPPATKGRQYRVAAQQINDGEWFARTYYSPGPPLTLEPN